MFLKNMVKGRQVAVKIACNSHIMEFQPRTTPSMLQIPGASSPIHLSIVLLASSSPGGV